MPETEKIEIKSRKKAVLKAFVVFAVIGVAIYGASATLTYFAQWNTQITVTGPSVIVTDSTPTEIFPYQFTQSFSGYAGEYRFSELYTVQNMADVSVNLVFVPEIPEVADIDVFLTTSTNPTPTTPMSFTLTPDDGTAGGTDQTTFYICYFIHVDAVPAGSYNVVSELELVVVVP